MLSHFPISLTVCSPSFVQKNHFFVLLLKKKITVFLTQTVTSASKNCFATNGIY